MTVLRAYDGQKDYGLLLLPTRGRHPLPLQPLRPKGVAAHPLGSGRRNLRIPNLPLFVPVSSGFSPSMAFRLAII